jgi:hypothetical protein|tara:strand:- start:131 stop:343 length:213 start_codon:yes stop_codon:yes gene_type:complete
MVASELKTIVFEGILEHKNPKCSKCQSHCFALYQGGAKERLEEVYICKKCNILYSLPGEKKCDLMEVHHV